MAGFVSLGTNQYIGTFKNGEDKGVENGVFVTVDYATGEAKLATADATDVYFVANEIDTIKEHGIDDVDYKTEAGKFLRLYKAVAGNILVTTAAEGLEVGDEVSIGANGQAVKKSLAEASFVVKEKTSEYGQDTYRLLAL